VRRDHKGAKVILVLLAVFGGIDLCAYLWAAIIEHKEPWTGPMISGALAGLIIIALLAVIVGGTMSYLGRPNLSQNARAAVQTLAVIGIGCVLALVFVLFAVFACLASIK
jgi:hypothetical protein